MTFPWSRNTRKPPFGDPLFIALEWGEVGSAYGIRTRDLHLERVAS